MRIHSCLLAIACFVLAANEETPQVRAEVASPVPIPSSVVFPALEGGYASETGRVEVMAAISSEGTVASVQVISSTNTRLDALCLAALKEWAFSPAEESGKPTIGIFRQLFRFEDGEPLYDRRTFELMAAAPAAFEVGSAQPEIGEQPEDTTAPIGNSKLLDYSSLIDHRVAPKTSRVHSRLQGTVRVGFEIAPDGSVEDVWIKSADHEELSLPALDAAKQWTFKPRPQPAGNVKIVVPFLFSGDGGRFDMREIVDSVSESVESRPVVLYEAPVDLASEESGYVDTVFVVDELGYVAHVEVGAYSASELASKVRTALYSYRFKPALARGKPIATRVEKRFEFDKMDAKQETLDTLPQLVFSAKPKLRRSLAALKGHVLMHLRIDERGKVTDARVMESSDPALIKPTLEATERCTFKPGYKNGEPVESTIVIPFFYPVHADA